MKIQRSEILEGFKYNEQTSQANSSLQTYSCVVELEKYALNLLKNQTFVC